GSNRLGTTSCDGRLKVRVPPTPPSFAKALEDRVVQENAVVSFDVDVLGYPEPAVTFHLKGKETLAASLFLIQLPADSPIMNFTDHTPVKLV
ncbi:hypothetical protein TELCIR_22139, partial [Teladorsagia circumcincta]